MSTLTSQKNESVTGEHEDASHELARDASSKSSSSKLIADFCAMALVPVILVIAFSKTVFGGLPISRFYQLGQRDSLLSRYYSAVREGYDASVYQYFVPNHVYTTKTWLSGHVPLWNPLTGCGAPQLADIETAVCWPLRLLLLGLEPVHSWNLLLVFNLMVCGTGTFVLARTLGTSRLASLLAGTVLAFCPYLVFQSELIGGCASLTPWVMASFVKCSTSTSSLWRIAAAIACAGMVISGHPEPVFFGISAACILRLCLALTQQVEPKKKMLTRLIAGFKDISLVGVMSLGLSAFILLPFGELLLNSECYKLGLNGTDFGVPLNTVIVNLLHPAYGNCSPFLGIVVPAMMLTAFTRMRNYLVTGLILTLVLTIAFMCRVGPLEGIMTWKALSWFVPKYCWPSILILSSVLAAFGVDSILNQDRPHAQQLMPSLPENRWKVVGTVALSAIAVGAGLLLCKYVPGLLQARAMDEAFDHLTVQNKLFVKDLILLGVLSVSTFALWLPRALRPIMIAAVMIVCTCLSMGSLVKSASPPHPAIHYDAVDPIPFLQQKNERIVSMGRHVLCPDSNLAYSIANIVPVNVYHPTRFQTYMSRSGVTAEGVNQFFDGRLGKLIDLASVKYAVSPLPVLSAEEPSGACSTIDDHNQPSWTARDGVAVTLQAGSLTVIPENFELIGKLRFSTPGSRASEMAWQPVLLDDKSQVIWFGDLERLAYMFGPHSSQEIQKCTKDVAVAIPTALGRSANITLAVQIYDWKNNAYIDLRNRHYSEPDRKSLVPIAIFRIDGSLTDSPLGLSLTTSDTTNRHYRLVNESKERTRVYENRYALPPAYVVHKAQFVRTGKQALDRIVSPEFDARNAAVVEAEPTPPSLSALTREQQGTAQDDRSRQTLHDVPPKTESCTITRPDPNTVLVHVETTDPGLLVLTDTYYPGWHAELIAEAADRKEAKTLPILRANYLFKAVAVPAGRYAVRFFYAPDSFRLGALTSALTLLALAGIFVKEMWTHRRATLKSKT